MSGLPTHVDIREVGPRDGFQNEPETIATSDKIDLINRLAGTGLRRIEVASFVRPDVIPQLSDGVEVLRQLKGDPRTALIPVIMLTTTDDPREVQRCYKRGCGVYVTKPVDYNAFIEAVKRLGLFLQVVQAPRNAGA